MNVQHLRVFTAPAAQNSRTITIKPMMKVMPSWRMSKVSKRSRYWMSNRPFSRQRRITIFLNVPRFLLQCATYPDIVY